MLQVGFVFQQPNCRVDALNYRIILLIKEENVIKEQGRQNLGFKIEQPYIYIINSRLQFSFKPDTIWFLVSQQEPLYQEV